MRRPKGILWGQTTPFPDKKCPIPPLEYSSARQVFFPPGARFCGADQSAIIHSIIRIMWVCQNSMVWAPGASK